MTVTERCKYAIGIVIGTAIGGVIYGIFLQSLLIQSLLISRRPIDPANWREQLTWKAWLCGSTLFFVMVGTPFWFLTRTGPTSTESGIVWSLIPLILLIQVGTVCYAFMRPELCVVESSTTWFSYFRWGSREPPPLRATESVIIVVNPVHSTSPVIHQQRSLIRVSYSLTLWKNWVQFAILLMEFLQLLSMALGTGIDFMSPGLLLTLRQFKQIVWQVGMPIPSAGEPVLVEAFIPGFSILTGFGGLYILMCGIFIALDLTVDSWLSPFLFTLLAGGFYGTITSGLLLVILYSPSSAQILVCLLLLVYYSSTAVFVSIYRSDITKAAPGEIRVIPTFTAIERVLKGVLAGVSVATNRMVPVVFGFCCLFFVLILRFQPYSSGSITLMRLTSVGVCAWTALLMMCADSLANSQLLVALLVVGWILVPVGMILGAILWKRTASV
jgi:hypothetical protein